MNFHKVETVNNFIFGVNATFDIVIKDYGSNVFRLTVSGERWNEGSHSFASLHGRGEGASMRQNGLFLL
jgi:hypothetical protein